MPLLALPYPLINPILVEIGPFAIRWYALAYIAGLIIGWALIRRALSDETLWRGTPRPSVESVDDLLVYCALGVIIGGRLGDVLFYDPGYYFAHPLEILKLWQGGMAFHGGLIGALCGVALFAWRRRAPVLTTFDLVALAAPVGIFLGRIANFIRPELWGRPTDVPWAVIFPGAGDEPRHPSQIYEALLEGLAVFVILQIIARRGAFRRPGLMTGVFGACYGLARIFCEFFREPDPRLEDLGGGLTMGMVLSAPLVMIGICLIVWATHRARRSAQGSADERAGG